MRLQRLISTVVSASALLTMLSACATGPDGSPTTLAIGSAPLESSALVYVAERQGFFSNNKLDLTVKDYTTGAAALTGLINNEVEIAIPAEYALAVRALEGRPVSAVASIAKSQYFWVIARRDHGINDIPDLKRKRIGVVTKTIAEFYLSRFLELNGLTADQVNIVNIGIQESVEAIAKGELDAIMTRPPYKSPVEASLGASAVVWRAQNDQPLYAVLVARNDWLKANPETTKRFLTALEQAEDWTLRNPEQAREIVKERLKMTDDAVNDVWPQNQFALTLDKSLIIAMEDQARWIISRKLTAAAEVPDFADFTYVDGLAAVKPDAVGINAR